VEGNSAMTAAQKAVRSSGDSTTGADERPRGRGGGCACASGEENGERGATVVMMVVLNPARGGEGQADGVAPRGRQGGGGAWGGGMAVGQCGRSATARGQRAWAAWPCHAADPYRIGGG
jgi:hypothetical protein